VKQVMCCQSTSVTDICVEMETESVHTSIAWQQEQCVQTTSRQLHWSSGTSSACHNDANLVRRVGLQLVS